MENKVIGSVHRGSVCAGKSKGWPEGGDASFKGAIRVEDFKICCIV